ncbi:MAG: hypothetical protein Q8Q37_02280 [bacterium]|nr:hypothetical protein [bacterium]
MNDIPTSITPPEFIKMIQDDSVTDQELEDLFSKIIPVNSGSEELTESQNREVMKLLKKYRPQLYTIIMVSCPILEKQPKSKIHISPLSRQAHPALLSNIYATSKKRRTS